jgi:hypothetical protein
MGNKGGHIWPPKRNLTIENALKNSHRPDLLDMVRRLWPNGLVRPWADHFGQVIASKIAPPDLGPEWSGQGRTGQTPLTENAAIFTSGLRIL